MVIIRRGAETEVQSGIDRDQAALIETYPEVAVSPRGLPSVSREVVVLMVLAKRGSAKPSNVTLRGLSEIGLALRPQVRVKAGRMFRPGTSEIVAGERIADGFVDAGLGERLRFGGRQWTVVGIFEAGRSGFASEIWGDVEQFMAKHRKPDYASGQVRCRCQRQQPHATVTTGSLQGRAIPQRRWAKTHIAPARFNGA